MELIRFDIQLAVAEAFLVLVAPDYADTAPGISDAVELPPL